MATPGWTEKKRSSAPMRRGGDPQKIYWEGINLNKISKKIVSAVTMGAFAMTLVPAAAFAAPVTVGDRTVELVQDNQTIVEGDSITVDLKVGANEIGGNDRVLFWVTDNNNGGAVEDNTVVEWNTKENVLKYYDKTQWGPALWVEDADADSTVTVSAEMLEAGDYTVHAGAYTGTGSNFDQVVAASNVILGSVKVIDTDATASDSKIFANGSKTTVKGAVGDTAKINFDVNAAGGAMTKNPLNPTGEYVYLWAQDANGNLVSAVTFEGADKDTISATKVGNYLWRVDASVVNNSVITAHFQNDGTYKIFAGVSADATPNGSATTIGDAFAASSIAILSNGYVTAEIAKADVETTAIMVNSVTSAHRTASSADTDNNRHEEFTINDNVTPSDTKVYTVKGTAWVDAEKQIEAANEVLEVSADSGLTLGGLTDGTVTTNARGEFEFTFTMRDAAKYDITITESNDDAKTVLTVIQDDVDAIDIEVAKDGGMVLAGTDRTYAGQIFDGSVSLADAVQFSITDAYGRDAMGPGVLADEAAANKGEHHADSLEVKDQPEDADVTADDFYLVWDETNGVYTLEYTGAAKDFTPGEYQVRVALNNGGKQAVDVTFTAAEFGTVQDIVLDMGAGEKFPWDDSANNNAITAIDDQVALGQYVYVAPKYVDENGLKVNIPNYNKLQVGINGDAVADRVITGGHIGFVTPANTAANNDYVGSVITVKVNDPATNKYVEKELTVVKNYLNETVSIDPTQGVVGEANTVNVSVVDENGNVSKVNGKLSATIVSQSDEEATVDLKVNPDVRNGKASMYLESDKAGTVDVRVVVTANNGELYADTFTYTFGDEDPYAGTSVVMTIGSDQYLINNELFDGSVDNLGAPYVDSAWRTMVPARILAETFGGTVEFDEVDGVQTVSIVNGDTTIEMTVGSADYTINGEAAKAMDTEPVIVDGRTYVPVRFVAEGLGLDVTPLYDAETGTTASVVFQK